MTKERVPIMGKLTERQVLRRTYQQYFKGPYRNDSLKGFAEAATQALLDKEAKIRKISVMATKASQADSRDLEAQKAQIRASENKQNH